MIQIRLRQLKKRSHEGLVIGPSLYTHIVTKSKFNMKFTLVVEVHDYVHPTLWVGEKTTVFGRETEKTRVLRKREKPQFSERWKQQF